MKRFSLLILCFLFCIGVQQVFAQTNRPKWVDGCHESSAWSYVKVISVQGTNQEECETKAHEKLLQEGDLRTGTSAKRGSDGKIKFLEGEELIEKAKIISQWYDGYGKYYFLVQVLKNTDFKFDDVRWTDEYRFSPRVFVPGMAQIYKGSTAKGIAFIAGEIAMIGGYVIADNMESSNNNKAKSTHNAKQKKEYLDNANSCVTAKNICLAGAAIVYAWNVIDGIVAKGKEHVLFGDASLQMAPFTTFDGGGLALRLKF